MFKKTTTKPNTILSIVCWYAYTQLTNVPKPPDIFYYGLVWVWELPAISVSACVCSTFNPVHIKMEEFIRLHRANRSKTEKKKNPYWSSKSTRNGQHVNSKPNLNRILDLGMNSGHLSTTSDYNQTDKKTHVGLIRSQEDPPHSVILYTTFNFFLMQRVARESKEITLKVFVVL